MDSSLEKKPIWTDSKLMMILLGAFIIRLVQSLYSDNLNHPDEIFQILEQAHRIVYGYGFIPWEYQLDARNFLVPGIMAIFLYPFKLLGLDSPHIYIPGIKIILSFVSLFGIISAFQIARKLFSYRAGLMAALLFAAWYEIVYFSVKPLSEVWSALFFLIALDFLLRSPNRRNIIITGLMMVLSAAMRFSFIPAVGVALIYLFFKLDKQEKRTLAMSVLSALALIGLFEWITVGTPFITYWNLYQIDKVFFMDGKIGSSFGWDYLLFTGFGSLFLIWLAMAAGFIIRKKYLLLTAIISITLLTHILLPVKSHEMDYRHIYLVIPIGFIMIAGLLDRLASKTKIPGQLMIVISIIFIIISAIGSIGALPFQDRIYKGKILDAYEETIFNSYDILDAYLFLHDQKDMIGLYDKTDLWFKSGGYYYLHRDLPVYFYTINPPSPKYVSHFMIKSDGRQLPGFEKFESFGDIDIYRRTDPDYAYPVDTAYTRVIIQPGLDSMITNQ